VLRPAAIYGPAEERHFPRIVQTMDCGLYLATIGAALVDWVHVDNLVRKSATVVAVQGGVVRESVHWLYDDNHRCASLNVRSRPLC
jgi:hypothetical protein